MGIYIFNKDVLLGHLMEDTAEPSTTHDFGHDILPKMVNRDKVVAYKFNGYWQGIGTVEAYYQSNMELTRALPSFSLDSRWPIFTRDNDLPPPRLSQQGKIKNSLISPGCVVKGEVENSILSPGVRVEAQAIVRNSVVMANTCVGEEHSVVDRCILDEEVNIGKFCYIGLGTSLVPGDWDITVLGRGVTVPHSTAIGRNCKVLSNIGPADFVTHAIPPGTMVSPR